MIRRFGFAQQHVGYDSAAARVTQVDAFLGTVAPGQRAFVWVHLFEPHEPYDMHPGARVVGTGEREGNYDAEVASVDDAIGQLRAVYVRRARRAAWIIAADHGEEFGEHGGRFHGTTVYEEQVRVPLIFEGPGVPSERAAGPASLVDVMPTVLAAVGIARPTRLRGRDLGPMFFGHAWDGAVFASAGTARLVARAGDRLICDVAEGSCELYDLAADPFERSNAVDARGDVVSQLQPLLQGWQESHGASERARTTDAPAVPASLDRLVQGDHRAAPELAAQLGNLSGAVAVRAVRALADAGVTEASVRDALFRALSRPEALDPELHREAGLALALLGDSRGEATARSALTSPDRAVARRAALATGRLGSTDALDVLSQCATDVTALDADRDAAAAVIAGFHDRRSYDTWLEFAVRRTPFADGRPGPWSALGDPRAIPVLLRAVRETPYALTRRAAPSTGWCLCAFRPPSMPLPPRLENVDALPNPFPLAHELSEPGHRDCEVAPHLYR